MAEDFAELGLESFNKITDKVFDRTYDKINDKRKKMSGNARYGSQPPAHRGYDDDPDNEYDDEEPRGPRQYGSGRDRDRYNDRPRSAYDEPRYVNLDRGVRYNDGLPPPSSREQAAPYVAAGAAGGAVAPYAKQRYDYDDRNRDRDRDRQRRRRSPSRSRSSSREDSRSDRGSRSGKGSRSNRPPKDSPALAFDKSDLGLGAGLAGALIGGYLGREAGDHKKRGTALGAVIGGIGANILEHRWKIYQEEKKDKEREEAEEWDRKQQMQGSGNNNGRDGRDGRRRDRSR